jgi:hypothetical protein
VQGKQEHVNTSFKLQFLSKLTAVTLKENSTAAEIGLKLEMKGA